VEYNKICYSQGSTCLTAYEKLPGMEKSMKLKPIALVVGMRENNP
jgi:hypothetical protein